MRRGFSGAALAAALVITGCVGSTAPTGDPTPAAPDGSAPRAASWFVQANLAGGWADGAETSGVDDVVPALVEELRQLTEQPDAVFLNEACESHAAGIADGLGAGWSWHFVPTWPGHSDCFPAPGTAEGRFGNAVVVHESTAAPVVIPSCNDDGAPSQRCLPNWPVPAEQRRAICVTGASLRCSVHLDPRAWRWHDEQLRAIARIAIDLAETHGRVIVGGDLNTGRARVAGAFERAAERTTARPFVAISPRMATYPARRPDRGLDHLLHVSEEQGGWVHARSIDLGTCAATWREDGQCTDHRVVVAAFVPG